MTPSEESKHCRNCGAAVSGHFCADCGQETRLHVPSAAEFVHEFVGHYIALEGKLWSSLKLLLFKPGQLTADYIEGRRARHVQPLRIYLTFSILFFALFKFSGIPIVTLDPDEPAQVAPASQGGRAGRPAASTGKLAPTPASSEAKFETAVRSYKPDWAAKAEHFETLPVEAKSRMLTNAFFTYGPYALFCLMPVFALYLKLLYLGSGRRYGEHLLFALHSNAFAYVMFGLLMLAPWGWLKLPLMLWLVSYLPLAMRRVYGGARLATAARWLALMALHLLSMALAIGIAFGLAIVH